MLEVVSIRTFVILVLVQVVLEGLLEAVGTALGHLDVVGGVEHQGVELLLDVLGVGGRLMIL